MNNRATRVARGWLVGVFATALAALSHAVAGGGSPSPLAMGAGIVFGGMLGTFALSSRPSLPRLAIAVGVAQLVFHLAFSTLGSSTAPGTATHAHDMLMTSVAAAPHAHGAPPLMWLSHAAAGLLTLALLRGAESAVWRLLTEFALLVVSPFRVGVAAATPPAPARPALETASPARLVSRHLTSAVSRRGPPLSVAF